MSLPIYSSSIVFWFNLTIPYILCDILVDMVIAIIVANKYI